MVKRNYTAFWISLIIAVILTIVVTIVSYKLGNKPEEILISYPTLFLVSSLVFFLPISFGGLAMSFKKRILSYILYSISVILSIILLVFSFAFRGIS